jgi:hypothetical protein
MRAHPIFGWKKAAMQRQAVRTTPCGASKSAKRPAATPWWAIGMRRVRSDRRADFSASNRSVSPLWYPVLSYNSVAKSAGCLARHADWSDDPRVTTAPAAYGAGSSAVASSRLLARACGGWRGGCRRFDRLRAGWHTARTTDLCDVLRLFCPEGDDAPVQGREASACRRCRTC